MVDQEVLCLCRVESFSFALSFCFFFGQTPIFLDQSLNTFQKLFYFRKIKIKKQDKHVEIIYAKHFPKMMFYFFLMLHVVFKLKLEQENHKKNYPNFFFHRSFASRSIQISRSLVCKQSVSSS